MPGLTPKGAEIIGEILKDADRWARTSERVKDDPRMIRQNGEDYAAVLRIIADAVTEIVTLTLHEFGY
jgi:hypothetical protein